MESYPHFPILIIDDEEKYLTSLKNLLDGIGINNILLCQDSRQVMHLLAEQEVSIILLDHRMPHLSGKELLTQIKEFFPLIPVIVISGFGETETIVEYMKLGAFDYFTKPVDNNELFFSTINRAIGNREILLENKNLKHHLLNDTIEYPKAFRDIITQDKEMLRIFQYCEAIAPGPSPVLITGDSGTGKELIAKAVHKLSGRKGNFIPVNIAGLENDTMFSDALFGHLKGAFTGATTNRNGFIEEAYGGTLFLDEIGDLEPASQVKLLRLIQEKEYYKLGSDLLHKSEIRIIAATNADLHEKMKNNKFRQDLYYRLKTHKIHLPPLIERKGDLYVLINHFFKKAAKEYQKNVCSLSDESLSLLETYKFPGNIRDLEAIITDAVASCHDKVIDAALIRKNLDENEFYVNTASPPTGAKVVFLNELPTINEIVDLLVLEALHRTEENQSQAGRLIGCSHEAIRKRLIKIKGMSDWQKAQ